jgi:hypothetical protein
MVIVMAPMELSAARLRQRTSDDLGPAAAEPDEEHVCGVTFDPLFRQLAPGANNTQNCFVLGYDQQHGSVVFHLWLASCVRCQLSIGRAQRASQLGSQVSHISTTELGVTSPSQIWRQSARHAENEREQRLAVDVCWGGNTLGVAGQSMKIVMRPRRKRPKRFQFEQIWHPFAPGDGFGS